MRFNDFSEHVAMVLDQNTNIHCDRDCWVAKGSEMGRARRSKPGLYAFNVPFSSSSLIQALSSYIELFHHTYSIQEF